MATGTWALVAGIVLVAAFLQTSTGFGFSQVSVPFLITLFAPRDAVQMTLILSLVISLVMLRSTMPPRGRVLDPPLRSVAATRYSSR